MTDAVVRTLNGTHVAGRAHDILLVALIALRPLVWSGDAGAWDNLAWLLLALVALVWLVIDAWRGRVFTWRFAIGGVLAAALLLILLPAALRSPYPSTGMGLWGMAVIHLGFAAYLMQVIPGRERLGFGALAGALAVECLLALGQWAWVLPKMAEALAGGDPAIAALENTNGDLANRVAYGGLFGTFTLANTLAAFLLLAAVPFIGVLRVGRGAERLITGVLIVIALIVALGTASKGAAVALLLAAVVVWTTNVAGRARWLALVGLVILGTAVTVIPQVHDLGAASAKVRLGYWQGATSLIAEAPVLGHGIHGFTAHGSRTMPLDAEPTRHVHNDVLEATVDGGVLAGLALMALLGWLAWRRPKTLSPTSTDPIDAVRVWQASWPLLLIIPLFASLGMLASNLEWWPLGAGEMTWWLWPLILAGVVIGAAALSTRLPLPPAWAWQLALAAFALHCLVDFNLQSPAIWGTLIVVAVLASGRAYALGVCAISRGVVTLLVIGLMIGWGWGAHRAAELQEGYALLAGDPPRTDPEVKNDVISLFGYPALGLAERWPADPALSLKAIRGLPSSKERLAISGRLHGQYPWNAPFGELFAQDLLPDDPVGAIAALRSAVEQAPAYLPRRQRLVIVYERLAAATPPKRDHLLDLAQRERRRITELASIVHLRNRLKPPTSGLPVQPTP